MAELFDGLVNLGRISLGEFWIPLAIWTLVAGSLYGILRHSNSLRPQVRFLSSIALLTSLPIGLVIGLSAPGVIQPPDYLNPSTTALELASLSGEAIGAHDTIESSLPMISTSNQMGSEGGARPVVPLVLGTLTILALLVGAVAVARRVADHAGLRRLRRSLKPVDEPEYRSLFFRAAREAGVGRAPLFATMNSNSAPMTFGWLRPVVAFPEAMLSTGANVADLHNALLHELRHVRRADYLIASATRFMTAALVWHPLMRSLQGYLDVQRELACDEDVITKYATDTGTYAKTLLNVSRLASTTGGVSMSNSRKNLTQRIEAMKALSQRFESPARRVFSNTLVVVLLVIPSFLVACATPGNEMETNQATLERLEAEVAYLEAEYAHVRAAYDEMRPVYRSLAQAERSSMPEYHVLSMRQTILAEMRLEHRKKLEQMRMIVAAERVLAGR